MSAKLIVASGKSAGRAIALRQGKLLIGRAEDCDIRPLGEEVSRRHCQIELAGDVITVADLGSRNGTYVNGDKIATKTRITVGHGDIVRVGPLEVKVETRAAGDKPVNLETGDDVSRWLMADDEPAGMFDTTQTVRVPDASSTPIPAAAEPAAAEPTTGEQTPAPVSTTASDDSAARATASVEALLAARNKPASLPADAKKAKSDSSRDAAADALRKFFGKR